MRLRETSLIAASVVLALALAACGGSSSSPTTGAATTAAPATDASASGEPVIVVRGGEPVDGVTTITVQSGDTVRFVVEADAPEEVHVHGFDLSADVGPGKPARFAFEAAFEGVFEVELENSAVEIARIEIEP